ncbi:HDIG domain-containing metalloprotein [Acetivibrio clariflavus]|uniref:Putative domain HDIG-containing protein n=1 Tax=Acetivibrio clariflavus (strain DSM 19732 / NBRC 101661 / EBR45) TaxID=720554 RepID=G8LX63_ACECE|nr:HDIG domain-containing metalloprotein [Acetivibrio clariflavus]AEV68754.1 putative domain HDIG-containing protein [Acetivibrio clariflavus DSM 19732]
MISKTEVFKDIENHLLYDDKPSSYLNDISNSELFKEYPLNWLRDMKYTMQSPKHHPEGSVWNHTMLVVDEAAKEKHKSKNKRVFMWAALLHDIGKPGTTKVRNGRITSYDHDKLGAKMTEKFLEEFSQDREFIEAVSNLVRWHMHILFVLKGLPFGDIEGMKKHTDLEELALLGLCDRMGRTGADRDEEMKNIDLFLDKVISKV